MENTQDTAKLTKHNQKALEYILEQKNIIGVIDGLQYFTKNKSGNYLRNHIRVCAFYDYDETRNLFNIWDYCNMVLEDGVIYF